MVLLKAWIIRKFPMLVVLAFIAGAGYYISYLQKREAVAIAQVAEKQRDVEKMELLVDVQTQSIEGLLALRLRDSEALQRLAGGFSNIEKQMGNLSNTRKKLEDDNEQIKNYLDTPIPAELRGLYNATPKGAGANQD